MNFNRLWAYLQLMRPANIVTAWADILIGFAASGAVVSWHQLVEGEVNYAKLVTSGWLLLSTTGLYGGGIVFNDVFDAELDAKERPERPIPSGSISRQNAIKLGVLLLVIGVLAAWQVSLLSGGLAASVALAGLLYDSLSKHHPILGPINMGICRGGNLLIGVSAVPVMVQERWFLALIPITYIAAITAISRGEVHGGKTSTGLLSLLLIGAVIGGILALGMLDKYQIIVALPFVILFAGRVLPPFLKAVREPSSAQIRLAVKAGVLSLIVLDATIAAGFANWPYGLLVLSLLPISIKLAQMFAVT